MSTMDRPSEVPILQCAECSCYPELCRRSAQAAQVNGMMRGPGSRVRSGHARLVTG
ncbi:hypothetical protein [Kibdelosporangium philippinense]|uniref:hypothetical protein n=1 Tax=Kibdelosporangium philippinense TaxID=211113 RepID=UPI00361C7892